MSFIPRPYQQEAVDAGINFFHSKTKKNGIIIAPTGSGKSLIIALIAMGLEGKTIIFQPSLEILQQNYAKFISYGYRAAVYSASAGQKTIHNVTFATIGSVANKHHLFRDVKNIIIDECHRGNFFKILDAYPNVKTIGFTATPIHKKIPLYYTNMINVIDIPELVDKGYLVPCHPYQVVDDFSDIETESDEFDESLLLSLLLIEIIFLSELNLLYDE